ncbi:MAG TPA: glycosyltransferase, partial [Phototrophicaceae bacterium]|nr:glycosyltransferase [Phototrophicaceae bacterium]
PGPHNPGNMGYLGELLDQRLVLDLQNAAHFLYELSDPPLMVDDSTIANLYQISDALFFPSTQEGFGIPLLEAALAGLPVFCSDIPPFRQTGGNQVSYFDPLTNTPEAIDVIASGVLETIIASPTCQFRRRVRQQFRWNRIIQAQLVPLLEGI